VVLSKDQRGLGTNSADFKGNVNVNVKAKFANSIQTKKLKNKTDSLFSFFRLGFSCAGSECQTSNVMYTYALEIIMFMSEQWG
jgi:hypothetical protein